MPFTVLIVEDNADNRIIYRDYLDFAGHRVLEAVNGQEAIERCGREQPDVVLMDLSMPVMDGWEAVKVLKSDPRTAHIPVLALSAHVLTARDYQRALDAGFDAYLTKPIEPKDVVGELELLMESRRGGRSVAAEDRPT